MELDLLCQIVDVIVGCINLHSYILSTTAMCDLVVYVSYPKFLSYSCTLHIHLENVTIILYAMGSLEDHT